MKIPGPLTDSSGGTASGTEVVALADGVTYANDVAALKNNLATLTATANALIRLARFLERRLGALEVPR